MLVDRFGREITYLRISVTDKCNLRCIYCMPESGVKFIPHEKILRIEEIVKIAEIFIDEGVKKIRITGGEPLVRKGVVTLVRELSALMAGKGEVVMTTNGTRLKQFGEKLIVAGLKRINIGINSLKKENYIKITRRDEFKNAMEGLRAAAELPFKKVKLNVVVMRGLNDEEVLEFSNLTFEKDWEIRFIEYMPFGAIDRSTFQKYFISSKEILEQIQKSFELIPISGEEGVAKQFKIKGARGRIGLISPMTAHFCENCNRMRLTSNGFLRPCLFSRNMVDIKTPLRNGASYSELLELVREAVELKPEINPLLNSSNETSVPCNMNLIGG